MPKVGYRYRQYTEQQKADAFAIYDSMLNKAGAAAKAGVPEGTFRRWLDARDKVPEELQKEARGSLLQELDKARWLYLEHLMSPAIVAKESGYYASQAFTKLNEAHQLLSGGPTARFSLAEYLKSAAVVEAEVRQVKAIPASTGGTSG